MPSKKVQFLCHSLLCRRTVFKSQPFRRYNRSTSQISGQTKYVQYLCPSLFHQGATNTVHLLCHSRRACPQVGNQFLCHRRCPATYVQFSCHSLLCRRRVFISLPFRHNRSTYVTGWFLCYSLLQQGQRHVLACLQQ